MTFEGQQPDAARQNPYGTWEPVLSSSFDTMRIRITRGRAFTDADDATRAPIAIVSESVAQRYWPGQDPIGKRVQFTTGSPWATVVGIAADTRYRQLTRDWLTTYFPARQFSFFAPVAVVSSYRYRHHSGVPGSRKRGQGGRACGGRALNRADGEAPRG